MLFTAAVAVDGMAMALAALAEIAQARLHRCVGMSP